MERFADIEILRYRVPGFEELSLRQKTYVYYLAEAALAGRDILFDQNGKYNLRIRKMLEEVYLRYAGNRDTDDFRAFEVYLKRVWFSSGIHHHYGCEKFVPGFSEDFLRRALREMGEEGRYVDLFPVIFDPAVDAKRVNQADGEDLIQTSACNYYDGPTQQEAEDFYNNRKVPGDDEPPSYGLNARLVKRDGRIYEETYKVGGRYDPAIRRIVHWLEKAAAVAENEAQQSLITMLAAYYKTGDLKMFDRYSIAWLQEVEGRVDFINGFIETYGDPLGLKGSWEAFVNYKDLDSMHRTQKICDNAQWFEDHSPVDARFKKKVVRGVSAKAIHVAILAGDLYPSTAIGINLPNAEWIRARYGSKSVTLSNIMHAYDEASRHSGFRQEFAYGPDEIALMDRYGELTDILHTDLHECLGHGSGQLLPGVASEALKAYGSTIEEARADLFGLYYLADPKLVELGLTPDAEAYKAEYYAYLMNGLMTQWVRIKQGEQVEEAHMRNRQLIAYWVYEHGQTDRVVEMVRRDGKTYVKVNDYARLRALFGELLAEIQRIKSTGDYEQARILVETYGVKIDPELHREVLARYAKLNLAPYKGFLNPRYQVVTDAQGEITDVQLSYDETYTEQMLRYSRDYGTL